MTLGLSDPGYYCYQYAFHSWKVDVNPVTEAEDNWHYIPDFTLELYTIPFYSDDGLCHSIDYWGGK